MAGPTPRLRGTLPRRWGRGTNRATLSTPLSGCRRRPEGWIQVARCLICCLLVDELDAPHAFGSSFSLVVAASRSAGVSLLAEGLCVPFLPAWAFVCDCRACEVNPLGVDACCVSVCRAASGGPWLWAFLFALLRYALGYGDKVSVTWVKGTACQAFSSGQCRGSQLESSSATWLASLTCLAVLRSGAAYRFGGWWVL